MCLNFCWTLGRSATETFNKKTCFWRGNSTSHHLINFHSLNMEWHLLRIPDIQDVHLQGKCTEGNKWVKLWTTIPAQTFCNVCGEVYGKNNSRSDTLDVGASTTTLHLLCLCRNYWCVKAWLLFAPSILLRSSTPWLFFFWNLKLAVMGRHQYNSSTTAGHICGVPNDFSSGTVTGLAFSSCRGKAWNSKNMLLSFRTTAVVCYQEYMLKNHFVLSYLKYLIHLIDRIHTCWLNSHGLIPGRVDGNLPLHFMSRMALVTNHVFSAEY